MSANILYVTENTERAAALTSVCAAENYALTVSNSASSSSLAGFDVIFADAGNHLDAAPAPKTVPVVLVFERANQIKQTENKTATDTLAYPFDTIEVAARLRFLSRLHMLQEELNLRHATLPAAEKDIAVLVIGSEMAAVKAKAHLAPFCEVECVEDDITGLLRAGQGDWACVILALSEDGREPASFIRQLRQVASTRTMPVLVYTETADERCVSALQAGANDIATHAATATELSMRIRALALRKTVLDQLRAETAALAPISDFDAVTGLPGPAQLLKTMGNSLKRLQSQSKPASLLLIAVDAPDGVPEGEPVPDSVMIALTQILRRSLRGFDYASRYSGDSFAILMPGTDEAGSNMVAKRICAEIKAEKVRVKETRKDGTTASIGLATMATSTNPVSAEDMIATALDSLAKAQALGAAQIVSQQFKLAA